MNWKIITLSLCIAVLTAACSSTGNAPGKDIGSVCQSSKGDASFPANCGICVITKEGATEDDIRAIAEKHDAKILNEMKDVGIYLFLVDESRTSEELDSMIRELNKESLIEKADFNYVFEVNYDRQKGRNENEE